MTDLAKARAEEVAEERKVFKELEEAEKEAKREEREKSKLENQEHQAKASFTLWNTCKESISLID